MVRKFLFVFSLLAAAAPSWALSPAAVKERAAIAARWEASAKRNPERFAQVRGIIERNAARTLSLQRREAPEVGRWGGKDEWRFRQTGENCLALAVAASLPGSKYRDDAAMVRSVGLGLDFLTAAIHPDGHWHDSDTNVDRFCLAPAAEAYLLLADHFPAAQQAAWLDMIRRAGEYQYKNYYTRTGGFGCGHYPNMDAYFALSISLAATLCDKPEWLQAAADCVRRCGENCELPGGAYEYVDHWNPVPVYQDIIPLIMGRYYLLTNDQEAKRQLLATREYYPRFSEVSGACDNGIVPFIKHYVGYNGHAAAPEFTAWLTGDGRNRTVADRRLEWTGGGYWTALMPQWISDAQPEPLPRDFLVANQDVVGFQMRTGGRFTAWITGRETAHDTLVSALYSDPSALPLKYQTLTAMLTEVATKPGVSSVGMTARFSFYGKPDTKYAESTQCVEAQPSEQWKPVDEEITVPAGMHFLRLDLFMFFKPGTVWWKDVALLDASGRNILPDLAVRSTKERPLGWVGSGWGTDGKASFAENAFCCMAPEAHDRASWGISLPVTPGAKLKFHALTRSTGIAPLPAKPLIYYITDMKPRVQQTFTPKVAVQHLESGLHAMGNGVRYPSPVDGTWQWSCWNGGSPTTGPWRVSQSWILAGGRMYGLLSLRCVEDSEGSEVQFRPIFFPAVTPRLHRNGTAVVAELPGMQLAAWPGAGMTADCVRPQNDTLRIDLPDGEYEVELTAGDPDFPLLPMDVYAGDKRIAGMQAASGKMAVAKAQVTVREGKLLLTFEPKTGDHWKLAALTIRSIDGKTVRRFDVGPATEPAAAGWTRLDGSQYAPARGFGWNRELSNQERRRDIGESVNRTLISSPGASEAALIFAGKPGTWRKGDVYTLDVALAQEVAGAGKDWGFTGMLASGVRGWWQRDGKSLSLVLVNDGDKPFAGNLSLKIPGAYRRIRANAGKAPVLKGKQLRGLKLEASSYALFTLE